MDTRTAIVNCIIAMAIAAVGITMVVYNQSFLAAMTCIGCYGIFFIAGV